MLLVQENHIQTKSNTSKGHLCSTHIRTEEENMVEQERVNSAKDKADEVELMKTTANYDNKTKTIE